MKLSVLHEDCNVIFVVDIRYIEVVVSYLHDCLVFVQKPERTSLLICTWLPTCQWLPLSYFFFSLRLGLTDFLVLHKDFNVILWFILGTLNIMSHTCRTVQYLYKNSSATPHLFAHRSPHRVSPVVIFFSVKSGSSVVIFNSEKT